MISQIKTYTLKRVILLSIFIGILLIIIVYKINEREHVNKKLEKATYEQLKEEFRLINEVEIYEFMNSMLNGKDTVVEDKREHIKIDCLTLEHGIEFREFLELQDDSLISKEDKEFMKLQFANTKYVWDCDRLQNVRCLTPKELKEIEKNSDRDFWELYKELYGKYGLHSYSKPIFNKEKTKVIVEHHGSSGWENGSGDLYLFGKRNGRWYIEAKTILWIR